MAKLTAKQRAKLPAKDFGLPEKARSEEARKESGKDLSDYRSFPGRPHELRLRRMT